MSTFIHPTAIIEENVQLGADCIVQAGAIVRQHTILGDGVNVHPYAVIGGDPQYLKFEHATVSGVRVGAKTTVREHVTINRSIHAGGFTEIGEGVFLMANAHVAHDSTVGNHAVLANNVMLAGHVVVGAHSFVGGGVGIHQYCRLGESVMVGGNAAITRDVPPFVLLAERDDVIGLNLVGLKRRGFTREAIRELKAAFHHVYFTSGNIRQIASTALTESRFTTAEVRGFLEFFSTGKRSFARARRAVDAEAHE